MGHRILLRGRPGVGKTTVVRGVIEQLRRAGRHVAGFVTTEMRESGQRVGFVVETMAGSKALLAHVQLPGPSRVGRYGVDLAGFEQVALPSLAPPYEGVVIVDELGPMELASERLVTAVVGLFEDEKVPVLATVHAARHPFTDLLIGRNDTELMEVTVETRDLLPSMIADALLS